MLKTVVNINNSIQEHYVENQPLMLANGENSQIKVLTELEYTSQTMREIQEILQTKHIIVTNRTIPHHDFDEDGLRTLRPLNEPISINSKSHSHIWTEKKKTHVALYLTRSFNGKQ